jgi:oxygen-independent coproporphyrinogen III oxidase
MGGPGGDAALAPPASLYVHVPLCAAKCGYCDFFSVPASSLSDSFAMELVEATLARAAFLAERFDAPAFETVYVGGGTPTALGDAAFDRLLEGIASLAPSPREWTVEANPESLDPAKIETMLARGATRVSMGAQSMDERSLALLGRPHDWAGALSAARLVAASGLALSADLIAGIPARRGSPGDGGRPAGPRAGTLAAAARELIEAGAGHVSAYDLTLEEGTPLAAAAGELDFPGEDEAADERSALEAAVAAAGFRRYEVSNYAARGMECLHNLTYWRLDSYIGAGPGAVSTLVAAGSPGALPGKDGASLRIEESRRLRTYADDAAAAASEERIAPRDAAFEAMMMAFRTSFGLDRGRFVSRFGIDALSLVGGTLDSWAERLVPGEPWPGSASSSGPALDGRGLDLLNRFLGDCLAEMDSTYPDDDARARPRGYTKKS